MRRIPLFISVLSIVLFTGCSIQQKALRMQQGFIDERTFVVAGYGFPPEDRDDKGERRILARKAALLVAKKRFVAVLADAYIRDERPAQSRAVVEKTVERIFPRRLAEASSYEVRTYDKEDACLLVYTVKREGLQALVYQSIRKALWKEREYE